ncbi:MAG: hypothetical protein IPH77_20840 [Ignavibacteria bacterium]|nr:hypothetical protein [Ignavibacteria bacterium]
MTKFGDILQRLDKQGRELGCRYTADEYPCGQELLPSVSGQAVHVVWDDRRRGAVRFIGKRSTDAGVSWIADTQLIVNIASQNPSVVCIWLLCLCCLERLILT